MTSGPSAEAGRVEAARARLESWVVRAGFQGWDPHDALNSPLLRRLSFNNRLLGIAWVQLLRRSPLNLRPLLRVPGGYNPKAMGLFLASYVRLSALRGREQDRERVRFFMTWLLDHAQPGYHGPCWGYNFDWPNRAFAAPAGTPTIVNTAFIGLALLDVARLTPELAETGRAPLETARGACDFILLDLPVVARGRDELCFAYTPLDRRPVHNASLLGAWLLAAVYRQTGEAALAEHARAAARYSVRRQRADGSWPYGDLARDAWVDNFHTGYVLSALNGLAQCLETAEFDDALQRGYHFWRSRFFLPDGTPKYYPTKTYPVDVHAVAQAILTSLDFAGRDPQATAWAWRVAQWGIAHMQDQAGYFHYQMHRRYRIRIPYMRWSQAWMLRSLSELLWRDAGRL